MTVVDPVPIVCPQCASTNTGIGASGNAICRDCAHLWNPDDPTAVPMAPVVPAEPTPDDGIVYVHAAPDPETYADRQAELVGGGAVLEGGQVATLTAWTDSDSIIVRLATGDLEEVPLSDVLRIMPPVPEVVPATIPDDPAELAPDAQLAMTLAKVIIRAGVESVNGTGPDVTPGMPPVGFLPDDPELHPVIERAAGLAVAMLIDLFALDVEPILVAVGAVTEMSASGDPTTEVASDERSGEGS